jgi:hypothetical protein
MHVTGLCIIIVEPLAPVAAFHTGPSHTHNPLEIPDVLQRDEGI